MRKEARKIKGALKKARSEEAIENSFVLGSKPNPRLKDKSLTPQPKMKKR